MKFDERIDALLPQMKALASELTAGHDEDEHERAGHVYSAILTLRKALSKERKAELAKLDRERAERLRAR